MLHAFPVEPHSLAASAAMVDQRVEAGQLRAVSASKDPGIRAQLSRLYVCKRDEISRNLDSNVGFLPHLSDCAQAQPQVTLCDGQMRSGRREFCV
jgi:hypothetical protein